MTNYKLTSISHSFALITTITTRRVDYVSTQTNAVFFFKNHVHKNHATDLSSNNIHPFNAALLKPSLHPNLGNNTKCNEMQKLGNVP